MNKTPAIPDDQVRLKTWKDFALRMARVVYANNKRPSSAWIEARINDFFDWYEDDLVNADSWDQGPVYVCDLMTSFEDEFIPHGVYTAGHDLLDADFESRAALHLGLKEGEWSDDASRLAEKLADEAARRVDAVNEQAQEQWENQWGGPARFCVRSGIDLVGYCVGYGTLGATMGDLRAMYPEGLPDFVSDYLRTLEHCDANGDWRPSLPPREWSDAEVLVL